MSLQDLPTTLNEWVALVQAALQPGDPVAAHDLLILTDLQGRRLRPMSPPPGITPREAAVLLLLYPDGDDLWLPLTVRSDSLPSHRGEVSLPGGSTDPDDRDPAATALRECEEELGIGRDDVTIWGLLTPLYIPPSNFQITPVVGVLDAPPMVQVNPDEVSAVITTSLRELLDPQTVVTEQWNLRGVDVMVPFFALAGHKVWGATALVLSEFVARLRRVQTRWYND